MAASTDEAEGSAGGRRSSRSLGPAARTYGAVGWRGRRQADLARVAGAGLQREGRMGVVRDGAGGEYDETEAGEFDSGDGRPEASPDSRRRLKP